MQKELLASQKNEYKYMFELLYSIIESKPPKLPFENINWASLYYSASLHSVSNMLCYALKLLPDDCKPPKNIFEKFEQDQLTALMKEVNVSYEIESLLSAFDKAGIDNLPLKGYTIKHMYPQADMRSMTDTDILFDEKDAQKLSIVMKECGFDLIDIHGNHYCYQKKPYVMLEMHSTLVKQDDKYYEYFKAFANKKIKRENYNHSFEFSAEDYYIFLLKHAANHFKQGGIGIRAVMDVYIYMKSCNDKLNRGYLNTELEKIGLSGFCSFIEKLAQAWFSGDLSSHNFEPAEEFILLSTTLGRMDVSILSEGVKFKENEKLPKSRFIYFLSRLFPSYKVMSAKYPFLKKAKILYPFSFIYNWCYRAFVEKNVYMSHVKAHLVSNEDDENYYKNIMNNAGL